MGVTYGGGLHGRIQRGGGGGTGGTGSPEKSQNKEFLSNTGPDPLKNHKASKPAFNIGPSSARQRNAMYMAFRLRAHDGPILVVC